MLWLLRNDEGLLCIFRDAAISLWQARYEIVLNQTAQPGLQWHHCECISTPGEHGELTSELQSTRADMDSPVRNPIIDCHSTKYGIINDKVQSQ